MDRLRKKVRKKEREREGHGEGEIALDRQLRGVQTKEKEVGPVGEEESGTRIVRLEPESKGKGKERESGAGPAGGEQGRGHINFWSEYESGVSKSFAFIFRDPIPRRLTLPFSLLRART